MDHLLHLFAQFNTYAKANPILGGGMALWGVGIVTWLCKGIPMRMWASIKRQCTTSLTFTSASNGRGMETFANFMRWFETTRYAKWSRSLSVLGTGSDGPRFYRRGGEPEDDTGTVVGVGEGSHFFMYRGRPFWLNYSRLKEGQTKEVVYQVAITGLGRDRRRVLDLIEEFRYKPDNRKLGVYTYRFDDWSRNGDVLKRPLATVVVAEHIKGDLLGHIQQWLDAREWFERRGLPYKLTCILRGLPGTGKTSLIKAIAGNFDMNVCMVNLSTMTDSSFEQALAYAPERSIIVIEDFDSSHATRARKALKPAEPAKVAAAQQAAKDDDDSIAGLLNGGLTLSGILNALDGILSLDGKIIFMTTNVYETIDPALLRKGRVDHTYELGALTDTEVRAYIQVMFPEASIPAGHHFADILGCDLQAIYFDHRNDVQAFMAAIPKACPLQLAVSA